MRRRGFGMVRDHLRDHVKPARDSLLFLSDSGGHLHESVVYKRSTRQKERPDAPTFASTTLATRAPPSPPKPEPPPPSSRQAWATPHLTPR